MSKLQQVWNPKDLFWVFGSNTEEKQNISFMQDSDATYLYSRMGTATTSMFHRCCIVPPTFEPFSILHADQQINCIVCKTWQMVSPIYNNKTAAGNANNQLHLHWSRCPASLFHRAGSHMFHWKGRVNNFKWYGMASWALFITWQTQNGCY